MQQTCFKIIEYFRSSLVPLSANQLKTRVFPNSDITPDDIWNALKKLEQDEIGKFVLADGLSDLDMPWRMFFSRKSRKGEAE